MRTRLRVTRAVVFIFSSVLWCAPAYTQQLSQMDMDMAHCGKKFRIATHVAPPYVMVDVDKCVAQKCGPEAFGNNGGVVYKLMMEHVLPQLRKYCQVLPHTRRPHLCTRIVHTARRVHWRESNRRTATPSSSTLIGTCLALFRTLPRRKRRSRWSVKASFMTLSCSLLQEYLRLLTLLAPNVCCPAGFFRAAKQLACASRAREPLSAASISTRTHRFPCLLHFRAEMPVCDPI
jgi:hypothetical protein